MIDGFLAKVETKITDSLFTVSPMIVEHDGSTHPIIKAKVSGQIIPVVGDEVLILTTRNNLDDLAMGRFYKSSSANARIVAIVQTLEPVEQKHLPGFLFTGNLKIDGDLEVTGDLTVNGNAQVKTDLTVNGKLNVIGDTTIKNLILGPGSTTNLIVLDGAGAGGTIGPL